MDNIVRLIKVLIILAVGFGFGFYSGYQYSWRENAWHEAGDFYILDDLRGWKRPDVGTASRLENILWKEIWKLQEGKQLPYVKWEVQFGTHKKTKNPAFLVVKHKDLYWSPTVIYSVSMEDLDLPNGMEMRAVMQSVMSSSTEILYKEFIRSRVAPIVYEKLYQSNQK